MTDLHTVRADGGGDAKLGGGISRGLVVLLAVACGASAANLYYAQPLLPTLADALHVSNGTAGLLVTISQLAYVLGLALLVPLGDLRERRTLITTTLLVTAAGMVVAAVAPGFAVFGAAIAVVGASSVVAQVIVAMSSSLAAEHERGQVVGTVMSGLLIGILLARTVSGLISAAFGWRAVFWFAAVAMLALAAKMRRALPRIPPTTELAYGGLLRSVLSLIGEEPILRQRMLLGALNFGCFSALWTSLAFLLSGPPYHYGTAVIGLFGLVGVAGAGAASLAGRLADRGRGGRTTTVTLVLLLVSWAILALAKSSVVALVGGIAILDLGVQGLHISNQSAIYALRPEARSRLTTAYMVAYFLGGAALSALASSLYGSGGWIDVCILGAATALLALLIWAGTQSMARTGLRRARTRPPAAPAPRAGATD
jgi:predicted MFS family arabinose efflux permease